MSKPFKPRKKKPVKIELASEMKTVRIDSHTSVLVSRSLSDEDARQRYYQRHHIEPKPHLITQKFIISQEGLQEKPVGSLEDIEKIEQLNAINGD